MAKPRIILPLLTQFRERVSYDPNTGLLAWLVPPRKQSAKVGDPIGWPGTRGYLKFMMDGEVHLVHRVAWLLKKEEEPPAIIDHADHNTANNRWINLRAADESTNAANKGLTIQNSSGYKGVCFDKFTDRWVAHLRKNGKLHNLGRFDTPEAAYAAYCAAAPQFHGEFARTS